MTTSLLDELTDWVASHAADVVLVCHTDRALAAAQAVRRRMAAERGERSLWDLGDALIAESQRLAGIAREGRLVVFLGAGIGGGAGLPTWGELLRRLATRVGFSDAELTALEAMPSPMDRAAVIQGRSEGSVGQAVADGLGGARNVGLSHALLACLPVTEAATTNYDTLFEQAREQAGRPVAVLPYESAGDDDGWLLKLHGSVDEPDDIVLTRDDYLSYGAQRSALRGLLQALLITRHMLFVGFSLTDENFHLIVHDVRQATRLRREQESRAFGTALTLRADPIAEELWRGDVGFVPCGDAADSDAARRLEVLLDHLLAHAVDNSPYLLDPTYSALLDDQERLLGEALAAFGEAVREGAGPAWEPVREFLRERGWDAPDQP